MSERTAGWVELSARRLAVRYLLAGVLIGGLWARQHGPTWAHALRLAVVLMVGLPLLHLLRSRLTRHRTGVPGPHASLVRLGAAKAVLVALALAGTLLLDPLIPHAARLIGLVVALVVAVLGPVVHRRLFVVGGRSPGVPRPGAAGG